MRRCASRLRPLVSLCAAVFVVAVLASPSRADVTDREQEFVYGLNVFTGTEYTGTFAPASVDAIYLLADHVAVLDPKMTEVYFWPITNDYRADWTALNELVPGTLEVLRDGRIVQRVELTDYVVQFDRGGGLGNGRISLGAEALARRAEFEAERTAYLDRLRAYTDETEQFNQRIDELRTAGGAATPPTPPVQPAPFTLYSSDLARGFPVQLAPGEYALQVRAPDGAIVAGSQKRLLAIAPRRQGIGYEVVPQAKWTMPETADDPGNVIYVLPGGVVYVRPFLALEFNRLEYARLQNPQDLEATPNRWTWVHVAPMEGPTLDVDGRSIALADYSVEQVPGAALGYSIVPFGSETATTASAHSPDLRAFRVEAPGGRGAQTVRMFDGSGRELDGSGRTLSATGGVLDIALALPILVPLALGATAALWRRERVLTARSLSPAQRQLLV
jgi:hypothetical protein